MIYYALSETNKEHISLEGLEHLSHGIISYYFLSKNSHEKYEIQIRKIAGTVLLSKDKGITWKPVAAPCEIFSQIQIEGEAYDIFRGYLPSGLGEQDHSSTQTKIPGKIIKIYVVQGDMVKIGDTLLVLEAMKMENEFKAGKEGRISNIFVKEGQNIEAGTILLEIE